jgi:serine/threonine-protein kinase
MMVDSIISHYKIIEKIGAGGMGEVYKAEDTKLKRTIALKFLSPTTLNSKTEKDRFIREAQAAAALNHPNIAHIYSIEETKTQNFIVMEYIDGKSLQDLLDASGGSLLPIDQALNYTIQVATGIQDAHDVGIVHRDIKSANIMITKKDVIKIMDFGLAKLINRSMLTQEGTTMGTFAYMSPEQAQGKKVDNRSDIWSLGVVIYEMFCGQLPFKGDYDQAVVYSIVNEEPEPITALRSGIPMEVERIVKKAMAKNPDERYQNINEMLVDLRILKKNLSNSTQKSPLTSNIPPGSGKFQRYNLLPWAISLVLTIVAIVLWILWLETPSTENHVIRFVHALPPGQIIEISRSYGSAISISPDGTQLVYSATDSSGTRLYRRQIDQLESTPINGTDGSENPFFSPDGKWVGFFASGKLKKVSLADGVPKTICEAQSGYGASWGSDNNIIFSPTFTSGLLSVPAIGGRPQAITYLKSEEGELSHRWPEILPDGKTVLFTINTGMNADLKSIAVFSSITGKNHIVIREGTNARYVSEGFITFLRAGMLMGVPFDVNSLETTGPEFKILDGVKFSGAGGGQYSFSRNGTLVWISDPDQFPFTSEDQSPVSFRKVAESSLTWIDRNGVEEKLQSPPDGYWTPSISPDGRRLAVTINLDIFILELNRGVLTRFTFEGRNHLPIWSPDGQQITFSSARNGHPNLFWKRADGSGIAKRILLSKQHQDPGSWTPDGKKLAYAELRSNTNWDILILNTEENFQSTPFLNTTFNEYNPMVSPDGRWLAYSSDESGRSEVYIKRFPTGGGKWQISMNGGREPLWARSGQEIFYRNDGNIMAVAVEKGTSIKVGRPTLLIEGEYNSREMTPFGSPNYAVSPDGRFLVIKPEPINPPKQINFVLNWFEELNSLSSSF